MIGGKAETVEELAIDRLRIKKPLGHVSGKLCSTFGTECSEYK